MGWNYIYTVGRFSECERVGWGQLCVADKINSDSREGRSSVIREQAGIWFSWAQGRVGEQSPEQELTGPLALEPSASHRLLSPVELCASVPRECCCLPDGETVVPGVCGPWRPLDPSFYQRKPPQGIPLHCADNTTQPSWVFWDQ